VRRSGPSLLRLAAGVTVLWFLGRQVGAAPFRDGLRAVTWQAVVAAVTLTVLTTVCSAWRWRVVARALGIGSGNPAAVARSRGGVATRPRTGTPGRGELRRDRSPGKPGV
jgi:hypothetical protein